MPTLSLEALEWEQDKIRHKATLWQWIMTWPEEKVDELRAWLDKLEEGGMSNGDIQQKTSQG